MVFGNVLRGGHGQLIPRQAGIKAGIPPDLDSMAVDMVCASGMAAIYNSTNAIRVGDAELMWAGGIVVIEIGICHFHHLHNQVS